MTKFVLNDMFEDIKLFLKRAIISDQIQSKYVFSLQFYIQIVEVLHCVSQKSNSSLSLSFPIKVENALAQWFPTFLCLRHRQKRIIMCYTQWRTHTNLL